MGLGGWNARKRKGVKTFVVTTGAPRMRADLDASRSDDNWCINYACVGPKKL
jgi:hypothetical protein